jgi:N-methylhydantoinase B/oxoprolinase/acetone carboxylase alpha subunit
MTNNIMKHLKCEFCGRMLFAFDRPLESENEAGRKVVFCDAVCREAGVGRVPAGMLPTALRAWLATDCSKLNDSVDPITLEVMGGALSSICKEMARTMERSAYSPVFYEGADMTTALFGADMSLIAEYEGIPAQMGSMKYGVRGGILHIGAENLVPGDVILHNDSYMGTPHLPEFCMVMPIFHGGRIIAYAANIAHHTDIGGMAAGSMPGNATEIFQEGIIFPPVKIFKAGVSDDELWQVYLANVRSPYQSYGDAMAMYASLKVAERSVLELVERVGPEVFETYSREVLRYGERKLRADLRAIPNGIYEAEGLLEDDGVTNDGYTYRLKLIVLDEDLIFDFRGSDRQARGPVNSPYGVTVAACANAIFNLVDPTLSHNDGTFRPFHFILPHGTIVNCDHPAALNGGNTESHNIIVECVLDALSQAIPERVPAQSGSTTMLITGGGRDKFGDPYTLIVWEGCGWGGHRDRDGHNAITTWVGVGSRTFPAEILESRYPWRVLSHELRADPGAGRQRGGLGCIAEYEILTDHLEISCIACRGRVAPRGRAGGNPGQLAEVRILRDGVEYTPTELQPGVICPTKFSGLVLTKGDRLIIRSPGGAGYGDPKQRPRDMVRRDVRAGYVTPQSAIDVYGFAPREVADLALVGA